MLDSKIAHRQLSTTAGKSEAQNKTTLVAGEVVNVKYGFSILDLGLEDEVLRPFLFFPSFIPFSRQFFFSEIHFEKTYKK